MSSYAAGADQRDEPMLGYQTFDFVEIGSRPTRPTRATGKPTCRSSDGAVGGTSRQVKTSTLDPDDLHRPIDALQAEPSQSHHLDLRGAAEHLRRRRRRQDLTAVAGTHDPRR